MKSKTPILQRLLRNFGFGLFIGVIFAIILAAVLDSDVAEGIKNNCVSIAAIIAATFSAFLALLGVRGQIEHQNKQHNEQIEHQNKQAEKARLASLAATKAFLPIALTEMCYVAKRGMVLRWGFYKRLQNAALDAEIQNLQQKTASELALSEHLISVFKDFIEYAAPDDGARISLVLNEYQIVLARWNGIFAGYEWGLYADATDEQTIHWAYLYALSSSVFEFSRNRASSITGTVGKKEILDALHSAKIIPTGPIEFDTHIDESFWIPDANFRIRRSLQKF